MVTVNEEHDFQKELKRYELFFKKRYKILYTVNDFIIGALFLVGSFFFFYDRLMSGRDMAVCDRKFAAVNQADHSADS